MAKKVIGNMEVTNTITSKGKGVVLSVNDVLADSDGNVKVENSAGFFVGQRVWHHSRGAPPAGMMAGDGQLLQRSLYPSLFNYVSTTPNLPIATEADWLANPAVRGCFTLGDGSTTFRIPDWNGAFGGSIQAPVFRGDAGNRLNGLVQNSAAPNITGAITDISANNGVSGTTGVFNISWVWGNHTNVTTGSTTWSQYNFDFDASRSSAVYGRDGTTEVRMNSLIGCNMIVFTSGVVNADLIDALALASQVSALDTKVDQLMEAYSTSSNGFYIGQKVWHNNRDNPEPGMFPSDGQLLLRSLYPKLFDYANSGKVAICSDEDWLSDITNRGCFTLGDGSTTFRVPDWNGKFSGSLVSPVFRGDGNGALAGAVQANAAPDVTGTFASDLNGEAWIPISAATGVFSSTSPQVNNSFHPLSGSYDRYTANGSLVFKLSDGNAVYGMNGTDEVRMNSIIGCNMIVYASGVINADQIDALQLSADVASLDTKVSSLEGRIGYALVSPPTGLALGSRTVIQNPFGNNVPVILSTEMLASDGNWYEGGWLYHPTTGSYGVKTTFVIGTGLVLRVGVYSFAAGGADSGSALPAGVIQATPYTARIHVWKMTQ